MKSRGRSLVGQDVALIEKLPERCFSSEAKGRVARATLNIIVCVALTSLRDQRCQKNLKQLSSLSLSCVSVMCVRLCVSAFGCACTLATMCVLVRVIARDWVFKEK